MAIEHSPINLLTKEFIIEAIQETDDLHIETSDDNGLMVWDDEDAKLIPFHFLEYMSAQSLADKIHISKDIPTKYQVDKASLAEYLCETCDRNAFITLDQLVVIWSNPDDEVTFEPSDFIDSESTRMQTEFGDEYAYEIGKGLLGQLWFERNIVVVNMGEVVRISSEIADENKDLHDPYFSLENQVLVGLLTTAIHELRHLQLDTNIILPEDIYPVFLGSETEVENYCRSAFECSKVNPDICPNLYSAKQPIASLIQSAEVRAGELNAHGKQVCISHER